MMMVVRLVMVSQSYFAWVNHGDVAFLLNISQLKRRSRATISEMWVS